MVVSGPCWLLPIEWLRARSISRVGRGEGASVEIWSSNAVVHGIWGAVELDVVTAMTLRATSGPLYA